MFVKDSTNKNIINTDTSHYAAILAARETEKKAKEVEFQLKTLQIEISNIKKILDNLTEKTKDL